MNLKRSFTLGILLAFAFSLNAYANSGPLVYEKAPGFSIAPKGETCIAVTKEDLTYDLSRGDGRTARVKASYEMKNTSDKNVEQVMLFPFVNCYSDGFTGTSFTSTVNITADGVPIKFKTYRLDDISYTNNYKSLNYKDSANKQLADEISMDSIVKMLNNTGEYKPKNFDLQQHITVYTLHLPQKDKDYSAELSFKIVPKKQTLLYYRAPGFEYKDDGTGKFTVWRAKNSTGTAEEYCFAVLGGDNKGEFKSLTGEDITAKEETIEEFLKGYKIDDISGMYKDLDTNDLYNYTVKKLDSKLSQYTNLISVGDDLLMSYAGKNYVGAFLYTVDFKPQSSMNVTVQYDEKATQDRRNTKNYSYMFLYLLRPASGWKSFSNLNVTIIPNTSSPYITGSSITLTKDSESGIYSGKFDTLPDKDLYFTTYKTDKPDPPPISIGIPYRLAMLLLSLILIAIIPAVAIKRRMRSRFNDYKL